VSDIPAIVAATSGPATKHGIATPAPATAVRYAEWGRINLADQTNPLIAQTTSNARDEFHATQEPRPIQIERRCRAIGAGMTEDQAGTGRSRRLALRSKNRAWLATADTAAGWKGLAIRKAGSGRSPVRNRSG
jgi:hypothetical protein